MENFLKEIWLRATPEDFNDPENFLRKQAEILRDKTFEKYDEETCLGQLGFLDNHILCVKNGVARTWDENLREMEFTIYDKNHYNNQQLFLRPHYTLPVIRYGIYEKDGRKICVIGSIQNKTITEGDNDSGLDKEIERKKYKVNKDVPQEDTSKIEPKNILALSIFISLLNREGITEIEAPGMFVLDHEYHKKRGEKTSRDFINEWTEERREREPDRYKWEYEYLQRNYKKEDLISEIKTERFIRVLTRLLHHYPNGLIKSYPGEVDSFLHLSIPIIKNKDEIRGDILKDIYSLIRKEKTEVER